MSIENAYQCAYNRGVLAAAAVADEYNRCSTHRYRLGDCVAQKLNASPRERPRLNRKRLGDPGDIWRRRVAGSLADVWRSFRRSEHDHAGVIVREVALAAGLTLATIRRAGVDPRDVRALRQAGIR
jgi:hypothetical protein